MRSGPAEETVVTDETLELKEQTELTDWVKVTATQGQFVSFVHSALAQGYAGAEGGQDQDDQQVRIAPLRCHRGGDGRR